MTIATDNGIHDQKIVYNQIRGEIISMRHSHDHHGAIHDHTHAQTQVREYRNYRYLFAVGLIGAIAEFLIALMLAHSVSAQADAIHALSHLSLYALACFVSRQIVIRGMDAHRAHHYHEQFLKYYALLVFAGLAWICSMSIIKLASAQIVVSSYMLISVSVGLCANIIALKILHNISNNHHHIIHAHKAHKLFTLDAQGDLAISLIVLITSLLYILFPSIPIRMIDPIISFCAALWIGWSGIQIVRGE